MRRLQQILTLCVALLSLFVTLSRSDEGKPLDDIKIEILQEVGECNRKAKRGDLLKVKYKGYFEDGRVFDDTAQHNRPFQFQLYGGTMIKGWQIGLKGACPGEMRKLTIPPKYGFGDHGNPAGIPGKAVLIFEIEIVSIEDGPEIPDTFSAIDADSDKKLSQEEVRTYFLQQDRKDGSTDHIISANMMFQYEDMDKDGFITHSEFNGPKHEEL